MAEKSNKELAVEVACEYVKSWNASGKFKLVDVKTFVDVINTLYDAISALDNR